MTTARLESVAAPVVRSRTSHRLLRLAAAVAVAVFAVALLAPLTTERGPDMDEGAVLSYADRVLDGDVPHRDFQTFYGPGSAWIVAGAFALVEADISVERAVGLGYRLLIVLGLFALALRIGGLVAAVLAGGVSVILMGDDVIWAYATYGAIGFGLLGLALLAADSARGDDRRQHAIVLGAGLAGGVAVLIRFDAAPAVVASAVPLFLLLGRRSRYWYAGGLGAAGLVYVAHLVVVGPERTARLVGDIVASGPARRLPLPRPWEFPGSLLVAAALGTLGLVVAGSVLAWIRRDDVDARILLAAGLFSAGLFPYALSRPDLYHVIPVALVPLALLPALALHLVPVRWGELARHWLTAGVAVMTVAMTVYFGDPEIPGRAEPPRIVNEERVFYVDDDSLPAQVVVDQLQREAAPGERLFVGPQDLRITEYNPTYLYFLFPQLVPASYYMEMNPNTANEEDSGLADEIRRADWLILTSEFQGEDWWGPNPDLDYGSAEPNQVVRKNFCLRLERGEYRLYERCDRAA